ncbi:UNVERIFIED_CONTAM: hypothetical protein FKN15_040080 [Acipenser sinensis]
MNRRLTSFISSEGVSYMTICSSSFSAAMAFCFLEDLRWEFRASYDNTSIGLVSRPYPFLEFDSVIQKIKHHYSYSSFPSLRMNLAAVEEELRVRPSKILTAEDMVMHNGTANGHAQPVSGTAASERMEPVTGLGILSLLLNIMCASLNLIRGVHLIEYTLQVSADGPFSLLRGVHIEYTVQVLLYSMQSLFQRYIHFSDPQYTALQISIVELQSHSQIQSTVSEEIHKEGTVTSEVTGDAPYQRRYTKKGQ